jgi:FkbM family methyltransferase
MALVDKLRDNWWLLRVCDDVATLRAMKKRGTAAPDTILPLRFRALPSPLLCRSGTSDVAVAWELFRNREYECTRGWEFPRVVDCGANVGLFMAFATMEQDGGLERYVGVEADRAAFEMLERQTSMQGLQARSQLLHAAAWDEDGEVCFDDRGPSWGRHVSAEGSVRVRALSIDSILDAAGLDQCDLLKLDIEGGERAVLARAKTWGPRVRTFVAELHDGLDYEWFSALAHEAGFEPYPAGALFRAHPSAVRR